MKVTEIGTNKSRIHCQSNGCRQRDNAEHEGYGGALTEKRITENNITNADSRGDRILEQILSVENLNKAYKQVKKNKGAHGVDGMKVENLLQYLKDNGNELREIIKKGKYSPSPVRRVEIPKDNGKMRNRIREITARNNALGYENLKKKLKEYVTGWINYFKLADMKKMLTTTDQWLRRRIRMYIWKQWKKVKTRYTMLRKLGLNYNDARKYSCTRKGYWRIAKSQIVNCTITDKRLRNAGYTFFLDYYETVRA